MPGGALQLPSPPVGLRCSAVSSADATAVELAAAVIATTRPAPTAIKSRCSNCTTSRTSGAAGARSPSTAADMRRVTRARSDAAWSKSAAHHVGPQAVDREVRMVDATAIDCGSGLGSKAAETI
jgi:hypothetical protein